MANFFVDYNTCRKVWWEIEQVKGKLEIQRNRVIQTKQILRGVGGYESVNPALDKVMDELEQQKNNLETLKDVLRDCMDCYEETEKTIAETGKTFTTEYAHTVLDLLGMIPGAGMAFDVINGLWYLAEDDYVNALMSGMAFLPVVGEFAGGGKLVDDVIDVGKLLKNADAVSDAGKVLDKTDAVLDAGKYVDEVIEGGLDTLSTPSSKVLRQNLIDAGVEVPDYPNAAHHIVAGSSPKAAEARAILQKYGVDINDAANGTFLPTVKDVAEGAYHPSLHTNAYYDKINKLLSEATCKEDVLDILEFIGDELSSGTFMQ